MYLLTGRWAADYPDVSQDEPCFVCSLQAVVTKTCTVPPAGASTGLGQRGTVAMRLAPAAAAADGYATTCA